MRVKGIPALAYIDDSCLANVQSTHGQSARSQWLAAAEAIHVAMLVSFVHFVRFFFFFFRNESPAEIW